MSAQDIARILAPNTAENIGTVKRDPSFGGVMGIPGSILADVTRPVQALVGGVLGNPLVQQLGPMVAQGYASGRAGDPRVGMQMAAQQQQAQRMAEFQQVMQQRFPNGPPIHNMQEMQELTGIAGQYLGHGSEEFKNFMDRLISLRDQNIEMQGNEADAEAAAAGEGMSLDSSQVKMIRETWGKSGALYDDRVQSYNVIEAAWGMFSVDEMAAAMAEAQGGAVSDEVKQSIALSPNPQAYGALVRAFARFMDPGSIVREAEANAVLQYQDLMTQLGSMYSKAQTGAPLETLAMDVVKAARGIMYEMSKTLVEDTVDESGNPVRARWNRFQDVVNWAAKDVSRRTGVPEDIARSMYQGGAVSPAEIMRRIDRVRTRAQKRSEYDAVIE